MTNEIALGLAALAELAVIIFGAVRRRPLVRERDCLRSAVQNYESALFFHLERQMREVVQSRAKTPMTVEADKERRILRVLCEKSGVHPLDYMPGKTNHVAVLTARFLPKDGGLVVESRFGESKQFDLLGYGRAVMEIEQRLAAQESLPPYDEVDHAIAMRAPLAAQRE